MTPFYIQFLTKGNIPLFHVVMVYPKAKQTRLMPLILTVELHIVVFPRYTCPEITLLIFTILKPFY